MKCSVRKHDCTKLNASCGNITVTTIQQDPAGAGESRHAAVKKAFTRMLLQT
jgi:hypothetical protein